MLILEYDCVILLLLALCGKCRKLPAWSHRNEWNGHQILTRHYLVMGTKCVKIMHWQQKTKPVQSQWWSLAVMDSWVKNKEWETLCRVGRSSGGWFKQTWTLNQEIVWGEIDTAWHNSILCVKMRVNCIDTSIFLWIINIANTN